MAMFGSSWNDGCTFGCEVERLELYKKLIEAEAKVQKLRACLEQMDPYTLYLASKADIESAHNQQDYRDRVLAETL